jgi:valyl-tRNA synthetase
MELPKVYQHKDIEEKIYQLWEKSGFFSPEKLPTKKKEKFVMVMPPPNANGPLHIGHAVFITIQDLMVRYQRMRQKRVLWVPGFDHAGFETQVVFDKKLEEKGKSRFDFSKEDLYQKILLFTKENIEIMRGQLKRLGASCDWQRESFTLEKNIVSFVLSVFRKLKRDGLLYKGERMVNWCPKHQTALSDLEVKYLEKEDFLYFIKYGELIVATTRPETKFGDVALAVHPEDKRYKKYIGKEIVIDDLLGKKKMKIVGDFAVDPNFGTGVLKVTPAHDFQDFEIAKRHKLKVLKVIDLDGKLNKNAGPYAGIFATEAREKVIEDLKKKGLLQKVQNYKHKVAVCYKCHYPIEPTLLEDQYFIKVGEKIKGKNFSLKELAKKAVMEEKVKFIPKRFKEIFLDWIEKMQDWNISRQIVWGIKIPDENLKREDVFDTWFSSSLWPIAIFKKRKGDFKKFYPTDVLETGYDILFFWVARMIMMGMYLTGKPPFSYVILHGLVRDKKGQKMSKSKGNVIDPLKIASLYGTDALRVALIFGNALGSDLILYEEKFKSFQKFANKIWNASRFVLMNLKDFSPKNKIQLSQRDREMLEDLKSHCKKITALMDSFQFHLAIQEIYHYFWHVFCDKIIEQEKERVKSNEEKERKKSQFILFYFLKTNLKLLHPFMPFITEFIYQMLPQKEKPLLMIENWPE